MPMEKATIYGIIGGLLGGMVLMTLLVYTNVIPLDVLGQGNTDEENEFCLSNGTRVILHFEDQMTFNLFDNTTGLPEFVRSENMSIIGSGHRLSTQGENLSTLDVYTFGNSSIFGSFINGMMNESTTEEEWAVIADNMANNTQYLNSSSECEILLNMENTETAYYNGLTILAVNRTGKTAATGFFMFKPDDLEGLSFGDIILQGFFGYTNPDDAFFELDRGETYDLYVGEVRGYYQVDDSFVAKIEVTVGDVTAWIWSPMFMYAPL